MSGQTAPVLALRELGLIGDRRTAALLDRDGCIRWYCPGRFDSPSLFAALLDTHGGEWRLQLDGGEPCRRRYLDDSGVLETVLQRDGAEWLITDFMPIGQDAPAGVLCRRFAAAPAEARMALRPRPGYAAEPVRLELDDGAVTIDGRWHVYGSHPLTIRGDSIGMVLPAGQAGWAVLADSALPAFGVADMQGWLDSTIEQWRQLAAKDAYRGPYERQMRDSMRALRLLTHASSGGVVAAATTSLPEVPGGSANWDYRYVWLRDAGMIASALLRATDATEEAERYLDFICGTRSESRCGPLPVMASLDQTRAPAEATLPLDGYAHSRPVRIGNGAREQLQLDGLANVLLAAKLLYQRIERRPHWDLVATIADFLAEHWSEPDHGMWEESARHQYTAGKVVAACGLDSIAEFCADAAQVQRWRTAVHAIRGYVAEHCLTSSGAYAVYAGSEVVDVSAVLFPVWAYCAPDTPQMLATLDALERDFSWHRLLYWRHLETSTDQREGAFLAATFWVAQYWVMRRQLARARRILDAALVYANDLGLLAEEANPDTGQMQGNLPQTFAHAALIGAVIDLKAAEAAADHSQENPS